MFKKLSILLEMIKFKHTVFALPFALMGAFLAGGGTPDLIVFVWVVVAMAGARTAAMGFNRIVDVKFDKENPRTAERALAAGTVSMMEAWLMVFIASGLFFVACYNLNKLTLLLSPFALSLTFFYSLTKRFTWLCHVVLGIALAFSPLGGYVAVKGSLSGFPYVLSIGVFLWVSGFDMVYACLDADFDRQRGLYSMPAYFGREKAFRLAGIFHGLAFCMFTLTGIWAGLNYFYYIGLAITALCLVYQHIVVSPSDLSRIQLSFFNMNGFVSVVMFVSTWASLLTATPSG
nr:UbiA family prenyltransferase [Desulfobulbaceae bacterium]